MNINALNNVKQQFLWVLSIYTFGLIAVKLQAYLTGLQKGLPLTYSTCPVN